jgi:hypothetical protein
MSAQRPISRKFSFVFFLSFSMPDENSPPSATVYALKLAKRKTPCVRHSVRYFSWPNCCGLVAQEILLFIMVDILAERSTPCATYMHWSARELVIWARSPTRKSHSLMSCPSFFLLDYLWANVCFSNAGIEKSAECSNDFCRLFPAFKSASWSPSKRSS